MNSITTYESDDLIILVNVDFAPDSGITTLVGGTVEAAAQSTTGEIVTANTVTILSATSIRVSFFENTLSEGVYTLQVRATVSGVTKTVAEAYITVHGSIIGGSSGGGSTVVSVVGSVAGVATASGVGDGVILFNPAAELAKVAANPSFVWSTVRLIEAYSGPAIRVLRPSDNAEADIGFSGYRLDEAALVAHIGTQIGQITRYYDQTGAGNHSQVQTNSVRRAVIGPEYRANGNLVTWHNRTEYLAPAALSFDRQNTTLYTAGGGRSLFATPTGLWRFSSAGGPYYLGQNGRLIQAAVATEEPYFPIGRFVAEFRLPAGPLERAVNDQSATNIGISAGTGTGMSIGTADSNYWQFGDGDAFIAYPAALGTADRNAVKAALSYAFGGRLTAGTRVLFVGDSITAGSNDARTFGFSSRIADVISAHSYTHSQGGAQLTSFLAGFSGYPTGWLSRFSPQRRVVFLHMGTNDLTIGARTAAQIYADIQSYASSVRSAGGLIIVSTLLPNSAWNSTQQTTRNDLNTLIRTNWASFADGFCDFAADPVMGPQAAAANTALYADGLHPSSQGHANLAAIALPVISALL